MRGGEIIFEVQKAEAGMQLGFFLRGRGVSQSVIRRLKFLPNGILVNGSPARTNMCLATKSTVSLCQMQEDGFSARAENMPLAIVYQSQEALVINKPAGMSTHPDPSHKSGTLANGVCWLYKQQKGAGVFRPIGRLDADTSGLVLCAGAGISANILGATVKKIYLAIVNGTPPQNGIINQPLCPQPGSKTRQHVSQNGKTSVTEYKLLCKGQSASLVAVLPKTGRTHQIRAHFAHIGHPLVADALYGCTSTVLKRHALHCAAISFTELSGNCPALHVALPKDMQAALWHFGMEYGKALLDSTMQI